MDRQEIENLAHTKRDEMNDIIMNAASIHGGVYARTLRESYNGMAFWYLMLQALSAKGLGDDPYFTHLGEVYSSIQLEFSLIPLTMLAKTPEELLELRKTLATDLGAMLQKIGADSAFVIMTGDRGETSCARTGVKEGNTKQPFDPAIWSPEKRQDQVSGDGGKDS